ncbi:MAG: ribonuclease III domain-containing protein [Firmicutes bacterium]|nr:ribonuclease III domain-containing protein [Bacillota bacterium]
MDKGLMAQIRAEFGEKEADLRTYSPLALAFLGDAVYSLIARSLVISKGNRQAAKLHEASKKYCCAAGQAAVGDAIAGLLSPEEARIYKRGRNSSPYHHAKHATMEVYLKATALETLCGYLYLAGEEERLLYLIGEGIRVSPAFPDETGGRKENGKGTIRIEQTGNTEGNQTGKEDGDETCRQEAAGG